MNLYLNVDFFLFSVVVTKRSRRRVRGQVRLQTRNKRNWPWWASLRRGILKLSAIVYQFWSQCPAGPSKSRALRPFLVGRRLRYSPCRRCNVCSPRSCPTLGSSCYAFPITPRGDKPSTTSTNAFRFDFIIQLVVHTYIHGYITIIFAHWSSSL